MTRQTLVRAGSKVLLVMIIALLPVSLALALLERNGKSPVKEKYNRIVERMRQ